MSKKIQQKSHAFNIAIAQQYGVEEAILLQNISFWIDHNKANEKNFYDGRHWTYNSIKAFHKLFPYMSEYKIQRVLKNLEDSDVLLTGNYNKSNYDRTKWYTLSENGEKLLSNPEKCEETPESQQDANLGNGDLKNAESKNKKSIMDDSEIDQPIPYINTGVKTNINNNNKEKKKNVVVTQKTIDEIKEKTIDEIKEKTKNHLTKENILLIIGQTGASEEQLLKVIELMTQSTTEIRNPIGWIISSLNKGFELSQSLKFKNNSNAFHNFQTGKDYTEEELLQQLGMI